MAARCAIVAAGVDARELRLEVRFLQRESELMREAASETELVELLEREQPALLVLGPGLAEPPLAELVRRVRLSESGRGVSVLALVPASDPPGGEGVLLDAGANAALRRPLERYVLESWVSKLVQVPRRVRARIPVHAQVVGSRKSAPGEHFYGLSRNLSVHGMLLASPVRIDGEDLDLELDLPGPDERARVLGRIVRDAPEVGWPYFGYGVEFLFLPEAAQRSIQRLVKLESEPDVSGGLWAPGAIHSTLRRGEWIYEITEPARTEGGFLVEIRRAARHDWRAGRASPFCVVQAEEARAALAEARAFVCLHG